VQHDDRALRGLDGCEHAFDVQRVGHPGRGVRGRRVVERRELDLEEPAASLPGEVETRVDRQSVEPGIEPARVAKPAQVLPCPQRRLLDRVARELRVAEDQPGRRVQPRKVLADEHAKGLMIALACPLDETRLVHGAPLDGTARAVLHQY
jgi:hypothetical protein